MYMYQSNEVLFLTICHIKWFKRLIFHMILTIIFAVYWHKTFHQHLNTHMYMIWSTINFGVFDMIMLIKMSHCCNLIGHLDYTHYGNRTYPCMEDTTLVFWQWDLVYLKWLRLSSKDTNDESSYNCLQDDK